MGAPAADYFIRSFLFRPQESVKDKIVIRPDGVLYLAKRGRIGRPPCEKIADDDPAETGLSRSSFASFYGWVVDDLICGRRVKQGRGMQRLNPMSSPANISISCIRKKWRGYNIRLETGRLFLSGSCGGPRASAIRFVAGRRVDTDFAHISPIVFDQPASLRPFKKALQGGFFTLRAHQFASSGSS
jgi:hypothetical protein